MPSRVLLTADTVGGVWSYALELARSLAAEGLEVALASLGRLPTAEQRAEAGAIPGLCLYPSEYRLPWMDQPWEDVRAAGEWLLSIAAEYRPDIAHLNEPVFAALGWDVPTLAVGHSCVLSWWEAVHREPAPSGWDRYRSAMRQGFAAAGLAVAPSRAMLDALARHYGVADGRVIYNGRDQTRFQPGRKKPLVLTAGRLWDQAKNVVLLDQAAPRLPWPVCVAGDYRDPQGREAAGTTHLRLLGRLCGGELAAWLGRASVYALPARYEPFGLSALEAALAGCALVLGDIASLRELWNGAAIFVDPDDAESLTDALEGLIQDAHLRQTLAMRSRRRALEFTPRRMALGYLDAYAALLREPREAATCGS